MSIAFKNWVGDPSEKIPTTRFDVEPKSAEQLLKENPHLAKQSYSSSAVNKMLSKDFQKIFGKKK
jgi:hypothetical protein